MAEGAFPFVSIALCPLRGGRSDQSGGARSIVIRPALRQRLAMTLRYPRPHTAIMPPVPLLQACGPGSHTGLTLLQKRRSMRLIHDGTVIKTAGTIAAKWGLTNPDSQGKTLGRQPCM